MSQFRIKLKSSCLKYDASHIFPIKETINIKVYLHISTASNSETDPFSSLASLLGMSYDHFEKGCGAGISWSVKAIFLVFLGAQGRMAQSSVS